MDRATGSRELPVAFCCLDAAQMLYPNNLTMDKYKRILFRGQDENNLIRLFYCLFYAKSVQESHEGFDYKRGGGTAGGC